MINRKRGVTIIVKILLPFLIGCVAIIISGLYYLNQHYHNELQEQIKSRAKSMANSIDQFVWIMGDSPGLERIVSSLGAEENIQLIAIFQCNPFSIVSASSGQTNLETFEKNMASQKDGHKIVSAIHSCESISSSLSSNDKANVDYIYTLPVNLKQRNGQKLVKALIYIDLDTTSLRDNAYNYAKQVSIAFLVAISVLTCMVYLLFHHYVFVPVSNIRNTIQQRASGNNKSYAEASSYDEIGDVAYALNVLLDKQEESKKEIMRAQEEAEAANRAKSEFLSNISHELRTPMHAILNFAHLGQKSVDKSDAEKSKKYLSSIDIAGQRLLALLNNLLDLAKMESGKMEVRPSEENLQEVIEHSLLEIDSLLNLKSQQIIVETTALSTDAFFDRHLIAQVVINLFSNAIKFSPENAVIRVVFSEALMQNGKDAALCCSIFDEGVGIPAEELGTVFDKFVQSSKTKTGHGGTGLGLSICKEIMAAHGGRIWAENGEVKGAIFSFIIPRTKHN